MNYTTIEWNEFNNSIEDYFDDDECSCEAGEPFFEPAYAGSRDLRPVSPQAAGLKLSFPSAMQATHLRKRSC